MKTFFKAVSILGTIFIGCGITSVLVYGADFHTVGLTVCAAVVAIAYNYEAKTYGEDKEEEVEEC
jgi:hypothetical protein